MRALIEMQAVLASIPAPPDNISRFRLYGIMIALGALLGLEVGRRIWVSRGGDPEDISAVVLWGLPAGLIGARLYHVVTDHQLYDNHWFQNVFETLPGGGVSPFAIWKGGLGIPGGIILGCLVGGWAGRRRGMRLPPLLDVVAVGLPLAQAVGRWGNYFNQELYGRPTSLPWGLYVDPEFRHDLTAFDTFHPTFLYEMLWNLSLVALLIWLGKKQVLRPGRLFAIYVGGYFTGRLWVEALRSDSANTIYGLRLNIWTSLLAIAGVLTFFAVRGLRARPGDRYDLYDDGHTWDPERGIVPAGGATTADTVTDPDPGADSGDSVDSGSIDGSSSIDGAEEPAEVDQGASGGKDDTAGEGS